MIKCEKGLVQMQGTTIDLLEELTCIMHALLEKGVTDAETLKFSVMLATNDKNELNDMVIKMIDSMDDIGNALKALGILEYLKREKEKK